MCFWNQIKLKRRERKITLCLLPKNYAVSSLHFFLPIRLSLSSFLRQVSELIDCARGREIASILRKINDTGFYLPDYLWKNRSLCGAQFTEIINTVSMQVVERVTCTAVRIKARVPVCLTSCVCTTRTKLAS